MIVQEKVSPSKKIKLEKDVNCEEAEDEELDGEDLDLGDSGDDDASDESDDE